MGHARDAALTVVIGALTVVLVEEALHAHMHDFTHTPNTYYGTASVTSTSTSTASVVYSATFDCVPFRVHYPQAVEILADDVTEHLPNAPTTYIVG